MKLATIREDLQLEQFAISKGYKIERKAADFNRDIPHNPLSFIIKNKHIWFCSKGWACADLVNGSFENHRYYATLESALITEAN